METSPRVLPEMGSLLQGSGLGAVASERGRFECPGRGGFSRKHESDSPRLSTLSPPLIFLSPILSLILQLSLLLPPHIQILPYSPSSPFPSLLSSKIKMVLLPDKSFIIECLPSENSGSSVLRWGEGGTLFFALLQLLHFAGNPLSQIHGGLIARDNLLFG